MTRRAPAKAREWEVTTRKIARVGDRVSHFRDPTNVMVAIRIEGKNGINGSTGICESEKSSCMFSIGPEWWRILAPRASRPSKGKRRAK